jgi:hypothetical protein
MYQFREALRRRRKDVVSIKSVDVEENRSSTLDFASRRISIPPLSEGLRNNSEASGRDLVRAPAGQEALMSRISR